MSTPGVVYSQRFVQAKFAVDKYSRYAVGYLSRPQAFKYGVLKEDDLLYYDSNQKYNQYGYMSNEDKTDGLFDSREDIVSEYNKYQYTKIFDEAQEKGCPLYQGVISFDNDFLKRNNIDYRDAAGLARLKEIARPAVAALIHESHLQDSNTIWTAAIHTNTDNIHIHIAIVEREKVQRRYDELSEKAFDKLKSRVANAIVGDFEKKDLSQIFQRDLPKWVGDAARVSDDQINSLMRILPAGTQWQYNRPGMAPYHSEIDNCVNNIITSNMHLTTRFEEGMSALKKYEDVVLGMYGDGKDNRPKQASENKLRDFYERAGNALLKAAKERRKTIDKVLPDIVPDARTRLAEEKTENHLSTNDYSSNDKKVLDFENEQHGSSIPVSDVAFANDDVGLAEEKSSIFPSEDNNIAEYEFEQPQEKYEGYSTVHYDNDGDHSIERLTNSANQGDSFAQYKLGQLYLNGKDVDRDTKKALQLFTDAAGQGNAYAAYRVAKMYDAGIGTEKSYPIAAKYYYIAFKNFSELDTERLSQDDKILYRLATMARKGEGTAYDISLAAQYYQQAADQGNNIAEYQLGMIYLYGSKDENGGIIDPNISKAFEYLGMAASGGNANAQYVLGKRYLDGKVVEKNEQVAFIFMRSAAAQGNTKAAYELAKMYRDGVGTEKDSKEAKTCFDVAFYKERQQYQSVPGEYFAEWTDEYREARNCLYGSDKIEQDFSLAYKFMKAEADIGNAYAIFDIARMHMDGLGVEVDTEMANTYYAQALTAFKYLEAHGQKSKPGLDPEAAEKAQIYFKAYMQYRIGKMYAAGLGTDQDYKQAAHWFQLSADHDNKFAQYSLGGLYYHGNGVEQSYETAFTLYSHSAKNENAFAAYETGKMCRDGIGTEKNSERSEEYFRQAYEGFVSIEEKSKDDKIECRLGKMLETGIGVTKNVDAAIKFYEMSSEMGNSNAQYALAKIYLADGDLKNVERAIQLLEKSSKNNNAFAQYALGCIYLAGENVGKDVEKAVQLLTDSALQENQFALYKLGCTYLAGDEIEKDVDKALQLLNASAEQSNAYADYRLGSLYSDGTEVQRNMVTADKFFTAAFDGFTVLEKENHSDALQCKLGNMLLEGKGCEKDVNAAIKYFTDSAEQCNPYAAYQLGGLYTDGIEVPKDKIAADKHFMVAFTGFTAMEEENHSDALQYKLGNMLIEGKGCEKNISRAVKYFTESANQNNQHAQYTLGRMSLAGEVVKGDDRLGFDLIKSAAGQGNPYAAYLCGTLYRDGISTQISEKNAYQYFNVAFKAFVKAEHENGDANLQYRLGNMLLSGEGCTANINDAVIFFERAADQDNQYAQYKLGKLYLTGEGVKKDTLKAEQLLTSSANQGNQYSQYALGRYYLQNGQKSKAIQWLRLSAAQGNQYAEKAIDRMNHPNFTSLRPVLLINNDLKKLTREHERKVDALKREFDYEQDYEIAQSKNRGL